MDAADESGYKPPPEFQEDARDPLTEFNITDSTELWLIQLPKDQLPDFDGQEVSLDLHRDGHLGTFEGSSGKSYEVVNFAAQEPDATVFLSSASESKIVGKITRRVSFVHYPEPSEVPKHDTNKLKHKYERSSATSLTNSAYHFATPTQSIRPRPSQSTSGYHRASTHSSGHRSTLSGEKEPSKAPVRRRVDEPTRSVDQSFQESDRGRSSLSGKKEPSNAPTRRHVDESNRSLDQCTLDSGRGHTAVASVEHTQEKKSKRRKKHED